MSESDHGGVRAAFSRELAKLDASGRRRDLAAIDARRTEGARVDFVSNDYLGLATHPEVVEAARAGLDQFGVGARAARLLGGGSREAELEAEIADWLGAEAALMFPTGYQANVGVISALAGPGDVVLLDELAHASSIDGARLSRARVIVHAHGDVDELEWHLRAEVGRSGGPRIVVVTEGVFGMDGDLVDLAAIGSACARSDAVLVVDEAHAIGVVGPHGAGAWSEVAAAKDASPVCVRVVTGGKALGVAGGFAVGDRAVCDLLAHRARSFVFTTAAQPVQTCALAAAVRLCRGSEGDVRRARVRENAHRIAAACGLDVPAAAIVPWIVGSEEDALALERGLEASGLDARAVRPPTVPVGTSRVRLVAHADTPDEAVEALARHAADRVPSTDAGTPPSRPRRSFAERCTFVVGTDTGIGKTVVSAMLVRRDPQATYWKPVQTGDDSDTETVARLAGRSTPAEPVFALPLPASPHEAARAAGVSIELADIDRRLDALLVEHASDRADDGGGCLVVELAGGLMVPYGDGNLQIDWLARRRPRIVLVARSGLGTLNHTMLSLEALRARRLEPACIVLVGEPHPSNRETLTAAARGVPVVEVEWIDGLDTDPSAAARLEAASRELDPASPSGDAARELTQRDAAVVWHPYTQHGLGEGLLPVARASGAWLELENGRGRVLDAISSWWTCLHGHGEPRLVEAMAAQARRADHVLFAGATHEPAVRLAERLVEVTRASLGDACRLARVFYSDNGSTAVEVALKMVLQGWRNRGATTRTRFVALRGGYHGDTCGAMSVGDPNPFFAPYAPMLFDVTRVEARPEEIADALDSLGDEAAGVIVEPLVQGAGGMRFHSPESLRGIAAACRERGLPWIADEVMTGFGRTGALFACGLAGVAPDFMCLSKGLTGGMLPLSATLATEEWFDAFRSEDRSRMLFHGHSFTANPVACAVALASLELCLERDVPRRLEQIGRGVLKGVQSGLGDDQSFARDLRQRGGIVALDLVVPADDGGYLSTAGATIRAMSIERGVLLRPLGNVVYALPTAATTDEEALRIGEVLAEVARAAADS